MSERTKQIVRQVLSEAADAPHFFDLSDAQRLNWMIGHAYELGRQQARPAPPKQQRRRAVPRRKAQPPRLSILVKAH